MFLQPGWTWPQLVLWMKGGDLQRWLAGHSRKCRRNRRCWETHRSYHSTRVLWWNPWSSTRVRLHLQMAPPALAHRLCCWRRCRQTRRGWWLQKTTQQQAWFRSPRHRWARSARRYPAGCQHARPSLLEASASPARDQGEEPEPSAFPQKSLRTGMLMLGTAAVQIDDGSYSRILQTSENWEALEVGAWKTSAVRSGSSSPANGHSLVPT